MALFRRFKSNLNISKTYCVPNLIMHKMVKMDFNNYFYIFRKSLNYTFLFFKFKNKTNKYFEKQSLLTCAKLNLEHNRFLKCSNSIQIDEIRQF